MISLRDKLSFRRGRRGWNKWKEFSRRMTMQRRENNEITLIVIIFHSWQFFQLWHEILLRIIFFLLFSCLTSMKLKNNWRGIFLSFCMDVNEGKFLLTTKRTKILNFIQQNKGGLRLFLSPLQKFSQNSSRKISWKVSNAK